MKLQALLTILAFIVAALVLPRVAGSAPAAARMQTPVQPGASSPSQARSLPAPTALGNLLTRCLAMPYAKLGRPGDSIDAAGRCGAIITEDGTGFREGTPEFRACRDAVLRDWLSLMSSTTTEPREELQLEASLACFHLLWLVA